MTTFISSKTQKNHRIDMALYRANVQLSLYRKHRENMQKLKENKIYVFWSRADIQCIN